MLHLCGSSYLIYCNRDCARCMYARMPRTCTTLLYVRTVAFSRPEQGCLLHCVQRGGVEKYAKQGELGPAPMLAGLRRPLLGRFGQC